MSNYILCRKQFISKGISELETLIITKKLDENNNCEKRDLTDILIKLYEKNKKNIDYFLLNAQTNSNEFVTVFNNRMTITLPIFEIQIRELFEIDIEDSVDNVDIILPSPNFELTSECKFFIKNKNNIDVNVLVYFKCENNCNNHNLNNLHLNNEIMLYNHQELYFTMKSTTDKYIMI